MGSAIEVDKMVACDFDRLFTTNVPHVLEKIFWSLDYNSFKTCLMVNKSWRELITTEKFSKRFRKDMRRELMQAAQDGNADIIKSQLSNFSIVVDVNHVTEKNETPLLKAAGRGHIDVVKLLLDQGAKQIMADVKGDTPLLMAAYYGHKDMLQLLLAKGARPNVLNEAGFTPLHWVALKGHIDLVQPLLESGANMNMANQFLVTPLHIAANEGWKEILQIFLDRGTALTVADMDGFFTLQYARMRIHITKEIMRYKSRRFLTK